jgi:multidrug efflux pump subunit AcrA (membrane-fusion protein)
LLPGAYVDVVLEGRALKDVVRMPRTALHQGAHVWVVDDTSGASLLRNRTVEVGWKEGDDVLITAGLQPSDRIVVSPISIPVDGMPVEVLSPGAEEARRD